MLGAGFTGFAGVAGFAFGALLPMAYVASLEVTKTRPPETAGDPYTEEDIRKAPDEVAGKTELDAVVAYLQALGKHAPRGG